VLKMSDDSESRPTPILASDAERERTIALLRVAVGEGRLTLEEFSERVGPAYAASTDMELASLARDLPNGEAVHPSMYRQRCRINTSAIWTRKEATAGVATQDPASPRRSSAATLARGLSTGWSSPSSRARPRGGPPVSKHSDGSDRHP
jgi:hypothetical protein